MADEPNAKVNREVDEAPAPREAAAGIAEENFRQEIFAPKNGPSTGSAERNSTAMQRQGEASNGAINVPRIFLEDNLGGKSDRLDMKRGNSDGVSKLGKDAITDLKNPGNNELKDPGRMKELENLPGIGKDFQDEMKKEFEKSMQSEEKEEGVEQLPTGDHIVRDDGKETLFTPNGDKVQLNPDGTHTIKGDVKKVSTDQEGRTTVEFGDGARVSFDDQGFLSVERDGQGVGFARRSFDFGGGKGNKGGGKFEGIGPGQAWPGDRDSSAPIPNFPSDTSPMKPLAPNSPNVPIDKMRPQQPQPKPELPVDRIPMEQLLNKKH